MAKEDAVRILLVEDQTLLRVGMRLLLRQLDDVEVVAEAADGPTALQLIQQHQPHIVFMDIVIPDRNGIEVTAQVSNQCPEVKVIILSMHADEEYVLEALQAGAAGYVMKDAQVPELQRAIEVIMAGKSYLSPIVSQRVTEYIRRLNPDAPDIPATSATPGTLTDRQRQILKLIAEGHSTSSIAELLNISVKTVESHRANIMNRLNIYNVAGLVRYAIRIDLIES